MEIEILNKITEFLESKPNPSVFNYLQVAGYLLVLSITAFFIYKISKQEGEHLVDKFNELKKAIYNKFFKKEK